MLMVDRETTAVSVSILYILLHLNHPHPNPPATHTQEPLPLVMNFCLMFSGCGAMDSNGQQWKILPGLGGSNDI